METQELKIIKKLILWIIGLCFVLGMIAYLSGWFTKVVNPDRAVDTYENFYVLYDQADQICNDIKVMQNADSLSGGFSRNERIIGLENKINEVIKDYNAKSKAWTRNMWKADDLPHTLNRSDFNCN